MDKENKKVSVCPHCHEQYLLEIDMLGKDAKCHTCRKKFTVAHLRLCPFCSEVIKYTAKVCKHCNRASQPIKVSKDESSEGWIIVVAVIIIIIFVINIFSSCSSDTSSPREREERKERERKIKYETMVEYHKELMKKKREPWYIPNQ